MSDVARAVMQAKALEAARIRQALQDISAMSLPTYLDRPLAMSGQPTTANEIEAENLILDPLGRGGAWSTIWRAESPGTAKLTQFEATDLPRFPRGVRAAHAATGEEKVLKAGPTFAPPEAGEYWFYLLVMGATAIATTPTSHLAVKQLFGKEEIEASASFAIAMPGWTLLALKATLVLPATALSSTQTLPLATIGVTATEKFPPSGTLLIAGQKVNYTGKTSTTFTGCTGGEGTIPTGTPVTLSTPGQHWLYVETTRKGGEQLAMTGGTACVGVDPEEPFYGDLAVSNRNLYGWAGGRDVSRSRRYGPQFDLLAMREREARLGVAPVGFTAAQRQTVLEGRWKARRDSASSTFIDLIVELIQTENKSFSATGVRVLTNFANRSFEVHIAYSISGTLAERVRQLIEDTKPAHLACNVDTEVHFGTFIAGVSKAGDHL